MKLSVTIDTEEDSWKPIYNLGSTTCHNIERIPEIQDLFDLAGVEPTYLVTYPVATCHKSISILKEILREGRCEIGTHCHPWNTPPLEEEPNIKNTMLCNLPADLQFKKLSCLHTVIEDNFGIEPIAFRAGRWGFNLAVAENLVKLRYRIDTSVTPFVDWADYYGPDFSLHWPRPFRFSCHNGLSESIGGELLEVPITIGFRQKNFGTCNRVFKFLQKKYVRKLKLIGLLATLNLLNRTWLSPEESSIGQMKSLTKTMTTNNMPFLNMGFHSSSLKVGLTPFVKTRHDEWQFLQRIKAFLLFVRASGIKPVKLSEILNQI